MAKKPGPIAATRRIAVSPRPPRPMTSLRDRDIGVEKDGQRSDGDKDDGK